jgi:hypothetical protein
VRATVARQSSAQSAPAADAGVNRALLLLIGGLGVIVLVLAARLYFETWVLPGL